MNDLISREEIKKIVKMMESLPWGDEKGNRVELVWSSELVEHLIDKAPSAEPKGRTGRWILEPAVRAYKCSCCGCLYSWPFTSMKYCGECGAKMEMTK